MANCDGEAITSDANGLLLCEVEEWFGIVQQFARCFTDHRDPDKLEFAVEELLLQRWI